MLDDHNQQADHTDSAYIPFDRNEIERAISRRFEKQVLLYSEKAALAWDDYSISYQDLNTRANQLSHEITRRCSIRNVPIGILSDDSHHPVISVLAALKTGIPFVILDKGNPIERSQAIIADSKVRLVLCSPSCIEQGNLIINPVQGMAVDVGCIEDSSETGNRTDEPAPTDLASIVYTSGVTGTPKGVCHTHRNILHSVMRSTNTLKISSSDNWLLMANMAHMGGINGIFRCLLNGATVWPFSFNTNTLNTLESYLKIHGITVLHTVPSVYRMFVSSIGQASMFPALRLLLVGGEAMLKEDVISFQQKFHLPCRLVNHLGCTEFSGYAEYFIDHDTEVPESIVPVGCSPEDATVYIVDDDNRRVEHGQTGKIVIESEFLSTGYWNDPRLTHERFKRVGNKAKRWYQSGDIGRMLADGCLLFLGRSDSQIQIGGNRIELVEVELALRKLPDVDGVKVLPRQNKERETFITAFIVLKPNRKEDAGTIKHQLQKMLPAYMIPKTIRYLDAFPLNANGKIDTKALVAWDELHSSLELVIDDSRTSGTKKEHTTSNSELIKGLCGIWREVLKIPHVTPRDRFFEIGGDSLSALRILNKVHARFGKRIGIQTLLRVSTIEKLAEIINPNNSEL